MPLDRAGPFEKGATHAGEVKSASLNVADTLAVPKARKGKEVDEVEADTSGDVAEGPSSHGASEEST